MEEGLITLLISLIPSIFSWVAIIIAGFAFNRVTDLCLGIRQKSHESKRSLLEKFRHESSAEVFDDSYIIISLSLINCVLMSLFLITKIKAFMYAICVLACIFIIVAIAKLMPEQVFFRGENEKNGITRKEFRICNGCLNTLMLLQMIWIVMPFRTVLSSVIKPGTYGDGILKGLIVTVTVIIISAYAYSVLMSLYFIIGCKHYHDKEKKPDLKNYYRKDSKEKELRKKFVDRIDANAPKHRMLIAIYLIEFLIFILRSFFVECFSQINKLIDILGIRLEKYLSELLTNAVFDKNEKIIKNSIIVVVLLGMDIILFHYYDSTAAVVKLYELITTLVVIPIAINRIPG